jgi:dTDP-D-glucose 4,6-dehydratase
VSSVKANKVLGWSARYSRDEALQETIDWYRDYFGVRDAGGPLAGVAPQGARHGS